MASTGQASSFLLDPPLPPRRGGRGRLLLALLAVAGLALAIALATWRASVEERAQTLAATLDARLETAAAGRALAVATWIEGVARLGRRLSRSELVQLFAGEIAATGTGAPPPWLADQLPSMRQLVGEFVARHDLLGAALLGRDGLPFLVAGHVPLPEDDGRIDRVARVTAGAGRTIGPLRRLDSGGTGPDAIALDIYLPVPDPAQTPAEAATITATLVMTVPAEPTLADLLRAGAAGAGLRFRLEQPRTAEAEPLALGDAADPPPVSAPAPAGQDGGWRAWLDARAAGWLAALRPELAGPATRTRAAGVPGTPWTVTASLDSGPELAALAAQARRSAIAAAGLALLLTAAFALAWAWLAAGHRRRAAADREALLGRAHAQSRLLETIAGVLDQPVGIKAADGRYLHVNPAFAGLLGRPGVELAGSRDADLFPAGLAAAFAEHDRRTRDGVAVLDEPLSAELDGVHREFTVSSLPVRDAAGEVAGSLLVARDRTAIAQASRRRRDDTRTLAARLLEAAAACAPRAARRASAVRRYGLAVATRLGLDDEALATLEPASILGQLVRDLIPGEPDPTAGDVDPVERAARAEALRRVGEVFELLGVEPAVTRAVAGMHERLDGSGLPEGRAGDEVDDVARTLGAIDAFLTLALARPPAVRLSQGHALYQLARAGERFDPRVIRALAATVADGARPALAAPAGGRRAA